jgi:succinate-acetate transporter protein
MKYETILAIALFQLFLMLPIAFYFLSLNMPGVFFTLLMISGMFGIITIYYPLITMFNDKE